MIRIGIVGAGGNGSGHARRFATDDRTEVTAVADPNLELGRRLAEEVGARHVADLTGFLDDVDAVVISSPNFLHPEHAVALARAGKHLLVEKPMALCVEDADRIVEVVQEAGVATMVGFSVRFGPAVRAMVEMYRNGTLGEIVSIWSRRCKYGDPPSADSTHWRHDFEKSGGFISELMAHEIDWICDAAGLPTQVYCRKASRRKDHPRANEHIWLTMALGEEATGTLEGSRMAPIADYYRGIIGTKAGVFTTEWGQNVKLHLAGEDRDHDVEMHEPADKHAMWLDAIEGKGESPCDVAWGRDIVRVTDAALQSAVEGRAVDLEW
jgi:predicted dehydrogenase